MLLNIWPFGTLLIQCSDSYNPLVYLKCTECEGEYVLDAGRFQIIYTPQRIVRRIEIENRKRFHRTFPYIGPGDASSDDDDIVSSS